MKLSIIAIVVSVISVLVAAGAAVSTYIQNNRINKINMKASYFHEIFDEYLITKIPMGRNYLRFVDDKLIDSQNLCDALSNMRSSALYFRYEDKQFYEGLKKRTQELEDYIAICGNKKFVQEEQGVVYDNIHKKIEDLYEYINNKFTGK